MTEEQRDLAGVIADSFRNTDRRHGRVDSAGKIRGKFDTPHIEVPLVSSEGLTQMIAGITPTDDKSGFKDETLQNKLKELVGKLTQSIHHPAAKDASVYTTKKHTGAQDGSSDHYRNDVQVGLLGNDCFVALHEYAAAESLTRTGATYRIVINPLSPEERRFMQEGGNLHDATRGRRIAREAAPDRFAPRGRQANDPFTLDIRHDPSINGFTTGEYMNKKLYGVPSPESLEWLDKKIVTPALEHTKDFKPSSSAQTK